jgi:hypothetical protein
MESLCHADCAVHFPPSFKKRTHQESCVNCHLKPHQKRPFGKLSSWRYKVGNRAKDIERWWKEKRNFVFTGCYQKKPFLGRFELMARTLATPAVPKRDISTVLYTRLVAFIEDDIWAFFPASQINLCGFARKAYPYWFIFWHYSWTRKLSYRIQHFFFASASFIYHT